MNAKWKKVLALMLALAMTVAAFCIPSAMAKEQKNEYGIDQMVVLGDSIAQGMNDYTVHSGPYYGCFDVGYATDLARSLKLLDESTSYNKVKNKPLNGYNGNFYSLEQSNFHPWGAAAFRTDEVLNMLDETFQVTDADGEFYQRWLKDMLENMDKDNLRSTFKQQVSDADLITLQVGANDIFIGPVQTTMWELSREYGLTDAQADLLSIIGMGTAVDENFDKTELATAFFKKFIPRVLSGYTTFLQNYPQILKKIRELNPNAQIVVVGIMNPLHYQLNVSLGDTTLELGKLLDGIVTPTTSVLASVGALYGCSYVDISDIPIDGSFHPTVDGYQTIANRIEKKLKVKTTYKDVKLLSKENKEAVLWASNNELLPGYSDTIFAPAGFVKVSDIGKALNTLSGGQNDSLEFYMTDSRVLPRKQLVTMLYNFAREMGDATALANTDALTWASATGITKGVSNIQMKAITPCTRAQAALFLYRFVNNAYTPTVNSAEAVEDTVNALA